MMEPVIQMDDTYYVYQLSWSQVSRKSVNKQKAPLSIPAASKSILLGFLPLLFHRSVGASRIGLLLNIFIRSNTWMIWFMSQFIGHVSISQVIINAVLMVGFLAHTLASQTYTPSFEVRERDIEQVLERDVWGKRRMQHRIIPFNRWIKKTLA